MQWLAAISVKRPVFASVLILALTVIGAFSFSRLGLDRFPKVDFPTVVVTTRLPGGAPEEVETEITDKIEEAVNTISAIDELRSTSSEGVSQVVVSFLLEKDADIAAQEVRDRVTRVRVESVQEFGDIVVRQRDTHPIMLRDVATVEDGMAEATNKASLNGEPTVLLTVRRQSGTNTVQVVEAVKERLAEVTPLAPA